MDLKKIGFTTNIKAVTDPLAEGLQDRPLQVAYTNDAASVQLVFTLADVTAEELMDATAIILLQLLDGSLFQDVAQITENTVTYLLTEAQGNHAGMARAQIELMVNGATYASAKRRFLIVPGIEDAINRAELFLHDWTLLTDRMDALEVQNIDGGIF